MRLFLCSCLLTFAFSLKAQYPVHEIPKDLLEKANIVIRLDQGRYEVLSMSQGKFKAHLVATILNKEGDSYARVLVGYDKLSKVRITRADVYNAFGKRIYKLKKSDIQDQSSISGFSVYEDNRLKYLDLSQNQYPYTIDYEYEVDYDFLYSINNWYVIPRQFTSVQKSIYTVVAPPELKPRYKEFNFKGDHFTERSEEGKTVMEWNFENIKSVEREAYGPSITELAPVIHLAPSKFEFAGYQGDMSSWDGFATWIKKLNEGRGTLPQATIDKVKSLVAGMDNDRDKIRAIYEYLQSNTRYVSIQLGIGGLQPFEANVVDDLGYGDCKALSNYTLSLLKAAGIKSLYTIIDAGDNPRSIDPDFTLPRFNHVVLCVPNKGDTVWLECTSQTNPFGYMGSFTGDRDVLLITDEGGKIVHTPVYDETVNLQVRNATVALAANGNAKAEVVTSYQGLKYEHDNLNFMVNRGDVDKRKWVAENTTLPNFDLVSYSFEVDKSPIPEAKISASYELSKYARANGKRLFFAVNFMNKLERIPTAVEDRETDFIQKKVFTEIDSITYTYEEKYNVEFMPEGTKFESKFGSYESSIVQEPGKLTFVRKFVLRKGRYPAEDYEKYRDFLRKVVKADAGKVVLNGTT